MSKNQLSQKQNLENQRIIEEWMKHNNSVRIVIEPDNKGVNSQSQIQNDKIFSPITTKNENFNKRNLSKNKQENTKRHSIELNEKTKITRWSSSTVSIKIEPANKTTASESEQKGSCSDLKLDTSLKQVSKPILSSEYLEDKLLVQNNLKKKNIPSKKGTKNRKYGTIDQKNIKNSQLKDEQNVYSSVLHNYKYLLTPKDWSVSVIEYENDSYKQCIAFFKHHVISENEKLIAVIQKSLIIDKGGTIHYSVHGLPVNVKGSILPEVLDSIKKLLSILHIFDKMQVCKGLGDDLLIVKTDDLLKDVCQIWRHMDCKLLLVKTEQCQFCLDTRNILLEKEMLFKSELLSMGFIDSNIKEELT